MLSRPSKFLILTLLFLLPLFGDRPGTFQNFALLMAATLIVAVSLPALIRGLRDASTRQNAVIFLIWINVAVAAASLVPIPIYDLSGFLRSQIPSYSSFSDWSPVLSQFLFAHEDSVLYPFLSFVFTLLASLIGFLVFLETRKNSKFGFECAFALLLSLVTSIVAGILDFYGVIDLRFMRGLDPVVNPNNIQYRLQSFFAHSGWFAEFVTLLIPFSMLILLLPFSYATRMGLLILLLVLGEFVLILTFQRGGWLSYPLTLLVVWSAVYVTRRIERGESDYLGALKRSVVKIIISIPLTVILSLAVISVLYRAGMIDESRGLGIENYFERLQAIGNTADRTDFIRAGIEIGKLHPIFGAGSESFSTQYRNEFLKPTGRRFGEIILPLHGSAHNVYAQTFAGKGVAGLLALLALLAYLTYGSVKLVFSKEQSNISQKLLLLVTASCAAAFIIYGNVQEIFYIQPLQILFFTVAGIAAATPSALTLSRRWRGAIIGLFAAALCFHLVIECDNNLSTLDRHFGRDFGCFEIEAEQADQYTWCGVRSRGTFRAMNGTLVQLRLMKGTPGDDRLSIYAGDVLVKEVTLRPGKKETVAFDLPPEALPFVWSEEGASWVKLKFVSGSHIVPAQESSNSTDRRVLAFRLYIKEGKLKKGE